MRTILAKINILANAFEKDGNLETAELLHDVFIKISKKKKKKKSSGKNVPNNPSLWAQCKAQAKQKFDVYPSAYANGWAAKQYKAKGGTWRKASVENVRVAQETIDMSLDPQVRDEQRDIQKKNNLESQKRRINYNSAYDGIKRYVLDGEGKTEFNTVQDYILSLNAIEEQNIKLMDFAKYVERLKVLSPNLDIKIYNNANQALYQAKLKTQLYSELNFRNVGAVNKTLKNMLEKGEISRDAYFTAIEMARLSSVIREN
jgi:hypothetical protein